jgi:hypothetical protein
MPQNRGQDLNCRRQCCGIGEKERLGLLSESKLWFLPDFGRRGQILPSPIKHLSLRTPVAPSGCGDFSSGKAGRHSVPAKGDVGKKAFGTVSLSFLILNDYHCDSLSPGSPPFSRMGALFFKKGDQGADVQQGRPTFDAPASNRPPMD